MKENVRDRLFMYMPNSFPTIRVCGHQLSAQSHKKSKTPKSCIGSHLPREGQLAMSAETVCLPIIHKELLQIYDFCAESDSAEMGSNWLKSGLLKARSTAIARFLAGLRKAPFYETSAE